MSDCGCKDKKIEGAQYRSPYDQQAHEMLAVPLPQLDAVRPERPDPARPLQEFFLQPANQLKPSLPYVFQNASPLRALSFGGTVPYNVVAFVVPLDKVAVLQNDARLLEISRAVNGYAALSGMPSIQGLDQFWIMRPGEIVDFGRLINGVAGFFAAPWSGIFPQASGNGDIAQSVNCLLNSYLLSNLQLRNNALALANSMLFQDSGDLNIATTGPIFSPILRSHFGPVKTLACPVTRTPWVVPNVSLVNPNSAWCVPPATKTMSIYFCGGTPTYQGGNSYQSGTQYGWEAQIMKGKQGRVLAGSWDIWCNWYGYDGNIHQSLSDYLTATGRGAVTPTHDCEIYDVQQSMVGVNFYWANNIVQGGNVVTGLTYVFTD